MALRIAGKAALWLVAANLSQQSTPIESYDWAILITAVRRGAAGGISGHTNNRGGRRFKLGTSGGRLWRRRGGHVAAEAPRAERAGGSSKVRGELRHMRRSFTAPQRAPQAARGGPEGSYAFRLMVRLGSQLEFRLALQLVLRY